MSESRDRIPIGDRLTIFQRGKKGIWIADFWDSNDHKKVSLRTSNKKVAVERATQFAAELVRGTYRPPTPTVAIRQAIADYLASLRAGDRAQKTLTKYAGILGLFEDFLAQRRTTRLRVYPGSYGRRKVSWNYRFRPHSDGKDSVHAFPIFDRSHRRAMGNP